MLGLVAGGTQPVSAQYVYFNDSGGNNGNWETATKWTGKDGAASGVLPTAGQLVYLGGLNYGGNGGAANPTVAVTSTTAVAGSISMQDATLNINAGALLTASSITLANATGTSARVNVSGTANVTTFNVGAGGGVGYLTLNSGAVVNTVSIGGGDGRLYLNGATINALESGGGPASLTNIVQGGVRSTTITGNNTFNTGTVQTTRMTSQMVDGATSGGITKTGSGVMIMDAGPASTYTGDTVISGGTIRAGTTNSNSTTGLGINSVFKLANGTTLDIDNLNATIGGLAGSGSVTLGTTAAVNAKKLTIDQATAQTFSGVISGNGGITKSGVGALTLSGINTYKGNTTINGGSIFIAADSGLGDAAGTLTLNAGTLRTTANMSTARATALGGSGGTLEVLLSTTLTHSGLISGAGKLTKGTGNGVLVLSNTGNTYQGGTAINAGTISISDNANLGLATSGLSLDGGTLRNTATVSMARAVALGAGNGTFDTTNGTTLTLSGIVSGAGSLTKTSAGTMVLSNTNTYMGGTAINNGVLSISSDANLGDATGALGLAGGELLTTADITTSRTTTLGTGGGTFNAATGTTLQHQGNIGGITRLTKSGAGTMILSGTNTYGATTVSAGILRVLSTGAFGTGDLTLSGGTLALANDANTNFGKNTTVTLNSGITVDRATAGAGPIAHTMGTLLIAGRTLSVTKGSNVTSGTAELIFGATTLTTTNGTIFDTGTDVLLKLGALNGNFSFAKQGAGQLTLTSAAGSRTAGTTTLTAGKLRLENGTALGTGTGTFNLNGGTLEAAADADTAFARTDTTVGANSTVSSDRLTNGAGVTQTLGTLSIGNGYTLTTAAGSHVTSGTAGLVYGATTLTTGGAIFDTGTGSLLRLGALGGDFAFTKNGAGQLTLTAAGGRTTGATTLTAGKLRLENAAALGTGTAALSLNGGNLEVAADTATTFASTATTVGGNATVTSDRLTDGAGLTHTLGTLSIGGGSTLTTAAGSHVTSGTAGLTFGGTTLTTGGAIFTTANGTVLTLGALGGNFGFTKNGDGQLTLASTGTRTAGTTTLSAGTLRLENGSALGTSATTGGFNLNGGTLVLVNDAATTYNGTNVTMGGDARVVVERFTNGGGADQILNSLSIGNQTLSVGKGAHITAGGSAVAFSTAALTANGATFDVEDDIVFGLRGLTGDFTFTKNGLGQMNLTNAVTGNRSAATTMNAGILQLENANALGNSATGVLNLNGGIVTLFNNASTVFSNTAITVGGDATLRMNRDTTGNGTTKTITSLNIGSSKLTVGLGNAFAANQADNLVVTNGITFTGNSELALENTRGTAIGTTTVTGTLSDGGAARMITKSGAGTLSLQATNVTMTNGTSWNVTGGRLNLDVAGALGTLTKVDLASGTTLANGSFANTLAALNGASGSFVQINDATNGLTIGSTNNLDSTFSGVVSGVGALTKAGTGTLTLSGANTFSGGTTVNAGRLRATTSAMALGAGPLVLNGGNVDLANDTDTTFGNNTTVSQDATITSDRLTAGAGVTQTLGTLSIAGKMLTIAKGANVSSGTAGVTFGATTLTAAGTVFNTDTDTLLTIQSLGGSQSFTKQGAGQMTLKAAGTRTGGNTTLSAGKLRIEDVDALKTGNFSLNGGTFEVASDANGVIPGSDTTMGGSATVSLDRLTTGVGVRIVMGRLNIGNQTLSLTRTSNVTSGTSQLNFNTTALSGNSTFDTAAGTLLQLGTFDDSGTARTLTKSGAGTLYVAGTAISMTDGTVFNLNGGVLSIGTASLGDGTKLSMASGTKLELNGANTLAELSGSGLVTLGSNALTIDGGSATGYGGVISGAGSLVKTGAGTQLLSGINTYTGTTTVSAGTLKAGANGAFASSSDFTVDGTLDLASFDQTVRSLAGSGSVNLGSALLTTGGAANTIFSGVISGAGGRLSKLGAGTFTLSGANTYTGATTVDAGKLRVTGSLASSSVTVQSGAALGGNGTVGGNVTVKSGGTLGDSSFIETLGIGGAATFETGSTFSLDGNGGIMDRINVTGAATIQSGAFISFNLVGPLTLSNYTLLTAASGLDGMKFTLAGAMPAGYQLNYTATSVTLAYQPEIGTITATPSEGTIITGGTTTVTVTVQNSAPAGSSDLDPTVTGSNGVTGGPSTATDVAPGDTATVTPTLTYTGSTVGQGQTGTVTVTDPNATNSGATGTVTVNVLDHAAPGLAVTNGNNQTVIVNASTSATLTLANGTPAQANLSPMDVQNLSSGLTGATGSGVIGSGLSSLYIADLNTSTVGLGQTEDFSLDAGDDQTLNGHNQLATQTATVTLNVLDHAAPDLTIDSGDNQSVIVGATGITAALTLANGISTDTLRSAMDVGTLSSGLTGATGSGVIASGATGTYTAALDTSTVGAAQTQTFSLQAGDQQTLLGADALVTKSQDLTLNVYGHADATLTGTTFDLGKVHLGFTAPIITATQTVGNGASGDYIVDLKAAAVGSGNISINGVSGLSAGDTATIAATLATGQAVGVINEDYTYTYADDSTLAGASSNVATSTLTVTGEVYSGLGVWNSTTGGSWGTIASGFGANWVAGGGTPGLDAGFQSTDTATFGTLGKGVVTLDGAAPSLKGITFNNAADSYELAQGMGNTAVTLNGGNGAATVDNLNGDHMISAPIFLATDAKFSVANLADRLTISGDIGGSGNVEIAGAGSTVYANDQAYTGTTTVTGGTLVSQSLTSSDVTVQGGTFSPGERGTIDLVAVKTLTLDSGAFAFDLGAGGQNGAVGNSDGILSLGDITLNGATNFNFTGTGFTIGLFQLMSGNTVNFTDLSLLTYSSTNIPGLQGVFGADATGLYFQAFSSGVPLTGAVLSNAAPYLIPVGADFLVQGQVTTLPTTGSNTINALFFDPASVLTVFNNLTVTSGELTVGSGSATVQGGTIVTPGNFTKLGGGLLNVLSNIITGGDTVIKSGTLAVNGNLTTGQVLVELGAWLKGSGIINGSVFNGGTVAPGNSPGTLTVNGNFTQNANGTLQIEVADNAFDQLIVSGRASLAGTLQAIAFGGHKFQYGDQVPFLRAGSIVGEFDNITMTNPSKFRGRFLKDGGVGTLVVAPTSYALVAENQNQKNVAKALDSFIGASGDKDAVSTALDIQTEDQYSSAFDQISPGFYQSLTDMVIEQSNAQNQMLAQRLSSVRLGARGFNVIGLDQAALTNDRDGKGVMEARSGKDIISPTTETDWSVFVQGNGIFARVTNVSQVPNYNFNSGGFIVGADYTFGGKTSVTRGEGKKAVVETNEGSSLTLGLYGGYQGTYARYANNGRMTINSAVFGTYASFSNGGFYSDLIVGGSYNGYRASRPIDFSTVDRTARSSPDGGTVSAYLDAGYDFHVGNFTFGPILSGQYVYAGSSAFTESGADSLDLRVEQQNANSLRTNIGGRVAYTWQLTDSITIVPEGRMFWQHEYLNGTRNIGASLDGGSGPSFDFNTSDPGRDSVFTGAGVSANFGDRWSTYFYYNADFGRQDFVSHMISGGLNWKF